MSRISVRKASIHDLVSIQRIGKETFFETFAESNTESDMQKYLEENFSEEKLSAELTNRDSHFFLAVEGETPIGYLKLNTGSAQTDLLDPVAIEIERIYVKNAYHGKKVGQILYDMALEVALEMNKEYLWLGVWEENPRAIRFYEKNGFVAFDKHLFMVGDDEQTDILMKKVLYS